MKITKIGHCCLLIEHKGLRILTDPGAWNDLPNDLGRIDLVLITHEHSDHLHIPSLKEALDKNPQAKVIANSAVGKLISTEGIAFTLINNSESITERGVIITGYSQEHAFVYTGIPQVENTGYFVDNKLFYPGDAFINPQQPVEVLALPVAGPWLHISEAIDYAKEIKPKICFPVHDGMLKHMGPFHAIPKMNLESESIEFKPLIAGEALDC